MHPGYVGRIAGNKHNSAVIIVIISIPGPKKSSVMVKAGKGLSGRILTGKL
jgi:hypothetical protein